MNHTKDLHLCGVCKKVFSDLNFFLEHKSQCGSEDSVVLPLTPTHDISLDNGLFCHEAVLDLTVLDSGSFLPILHCESEEVVSEAVELQSQEQIFQDRIIAEKTKNNFLPNHVSKSNSEKVLTYSSSNKQSTKCLNKGVNNHKDLDIRDNHLRQAETLSKNAVVDTENKNEDVDKNADKQKIVCNVCNFVTLYHRDLVRHMRKHSGERPYLCSICGKKFARQDKLTCHKRIHVGDKRYKCQLCEYATTDGGALRKHLQIHSDDRPHRCQMCSYRARNSSHMTIHLRTHTGDSPFFCQFENCAKTFKTSSDLQRHLKVHKLRSDPPSHYDIVKRKQKRIRKRGMLSCDRPHKCSVCNSSFVRQDSLRCHMKLHSHLNAENKDNSSPTSHLPNEEPSNVNAALPKTISLSLETAISDSSYL